MFAPDEFKAAVLPEQMVIVLGEIATNGVVLTDTVAAEELVHPPKVFVPVTV